MSDANQWKNKFQDLMQVCQAELKKTAEIGKKMITAGQSNAEMTDSFEELGKLAFNSITNGDLTWENEKVHELIDRIKSIKEELEKLESDVQNIKKED